MMNAVLSGAHNFRATCKKTSFAPCIHGPSHEASEQTPVETVLLTAVTVTKGQAHAMDPNG